ncbi:MAG: hypothetical protein JNL19_14520 [Burkholderiales bacterium]|nr:hypothetical protein [Burkholderiales bacterium]
MPCLATASSARLSPFLVASLLAASSVHAAPQVLDVEWKDAARQRVVPLKVRVPEGDAKLPLVLFSHGLGGSREGGRRWGEHWAANGYLVIHVQHPGSDESLWRGAGATEPTALRQGLARGATPEQLLGRVDDIRFVLDELAKQQGNADAAAWQTRADLMRIAMTGHSFGALTTMALAGVRYPGPIKSLADPRIGAFIAFSPSVQGLKRSWPERYGDMTRPFLSVTGTIDGDVMGTGAEAARRAALFDAQPGGNAYRVVFADGDHAVFGGGDRRDTAWMQRVTGGQAATSADVFRLIQERTATITLKFLDAWLKQDAAAKRWLTTDATKLVGETGEWSAK